MTKKQLIAASSLPVLDYGDIIYSHATSHSLSWKTSDSSQTSNHSHRVVWSSRCFTDCHLFIYKSSLVFLFFFIYGHTLHSNWTSVTVRFHFVHRIRIKTEILICAPFDWNQQQNEMSMRELVTLNSFKSVLLILTTALVVADLKCMWRFIVISVMEFCVLFVCRCLWGKSLS